jgi:hypothetical protein
MAQELEDVLGGVYTVLAILSGLDPLRPRAFCAASWSADGDLLRSRRRYM